MEQCVGLAMAWLLLGLSLPTQAEKGCHVNSKVNATQHETVTLQCRVNSTSCAHGVIMWMKMITIEDLEVILIRDEHNNVTVKNPWSPDRIRLAGSPQNTSLVLTDVSLADGGKYVCERKCPKLFTASVDLAVRELKSPVPPRSPGPKTESTARKESTVSMLSPTLTNKTTAQTDRGCLAKDGSARGDITAPDQHMWYYILGAAILLLALLVLVYFACVRKAACPPQGTKGKPPPKETENMCQDPAEVLYETVNLDDELIPYATCVRNAECPPKSPIGKTQPKATENPSQVPAEFFYETVNVGDAVVPDSANKNSGIQDFREPAVITTISDTSPPQHS